MSELLSRRRFLGQLGLGALGLALGWRPAGQQAWALGEGVPSPRAARRLVVVLLRGAVDGLSVLVPHGEAGYAARRPSIAIPAPGRPGGALPLSGPLGLHPALAALHRRWAAGQAGWVPASGSHHPTRSHFEAQAMLEAGLAQGVGHEGWLNRLALVLGSQPTGRAMALNWGEAVPLALAGPAPVACTEARRGPSTEGPLQRAGAQAALKALYAADPQLGPVVGRGLAERQRLEEDAASAEAMEADAEAPLPEQGFAQDAHALGAMMRADAGLRLAFMATGGWDTHARQGASTGLLATRLHAVDQGLEALAKALGPVWADTVVVVLSEFGRTVAENGSGGTDHGHGTPMWLLGGRLAGGQLWGPWPGLEPAQLHEGRDLAVAVERRSVLASLVGEQLELGPEAVARVFPGVQGGPPWGGRWLRA